MNKRVFAAVLAIGLASPLAQLVRYSIREASNMILMVPTVLCVCAVDRGC